MGCLSFLLIPDAGSLSDAMTSFKNGFLTRVPWGYATRFFTIVSGNATATLPTLQVTLPSNFPSDLRNIALPDLTPWNAFATTSILSTATSSDNKTIWDTVTPIWNTVVLFAFAVGVVHELLGFFGGGDDGSSFSESESDSMTVADGKTHIKHSESWNRRRRVSRKQWQNRFK